MGQALGLLALQDRGPGLALSPGAARCFGAITNPTIFFTNHIFRQVFVVVVVVLIFSLFA